MKGLFQKIEPTPFLACEGWIVINDAAFKPDDVALVHVVGRRKQPIKRMEIVTKHGDLIRYNGTIENTLVSIENYKKDQVKQARAKRIAKRKRS